MQPEIPRKKDGHKQRANMRLTFQEDKVNQHDPYAKEDHPGPRSSPQRAAPQGHAHEPPPRKEGRGGRGKGEGKGSEASGGKNSTFPVPNGEEGEAPFASFEDVEGNIYATSKDQYGCRFLQKMLEEGNPAHIQSIFNEVYKHSAELMTDPFGNYLMQKLVEHCNNDQRTAIVQTVAPHLVSISLNMHGTRAVQTLIENLTTPPQVWRVCGRARVCGSGVVC